MKRTINIMMLIAICIIEFIYSAADALEIADISGTKFMMLVVVKMFFIYREGKYNRIEYREKMRRKRLVEKAFRKSA